jgi:DNA-binding response OmpR family regulator
MANQQKLNILVIDDEVTQRMLVKEYLEEAGHAVRLSEDGKRGLKMASSTNPDIILLDLMLPSIDGYSLCKMLKGNPATAEIPVILITASREADVIEKGLAAGADDFLTKPVDWAFLSDRVLNVVAKTKERSEMARLLRVQMAMPAVVAPAPAPTHEMEAQLDELMRSAELQLEQAREASVAERARLEAEHAEVLNKAIDELRNDFEAEFDAEIAHREALHADAITKAVKLARAEFEAQMTGREAVHAQALSRAIAQARSEAEAEIANRHSLYESSVDQELKQARSEFETQLASLKSQHGEELRSLHERRELDIDTIRNSARHEQLVAERRHANEMSVLRAAVEAANIRISALSAAAPAEKANGAGPQVQAAWNLALRSTTAQSILASAIAAKTNAAATAGVGSVEHADLDRTVRSLNNLLASFKLLAQSMAAPGGAPETPVDLGLLSSDIAAQASRMARDRNVEVRCNRIEPAIAVMADESRLRYAWMCLVINAIRFTPAGGSVELAVSANNDGSIRLGVSDTGVGIAPVKLRELRTCLDESSPDQSARPGESAGLGIPVATALARQMGGKVELDSQLGNGTHAALVFPASKTLPVNFGQGGHFSRSA